jgi:type IV pilus assembly protein PilM
MHLRSLVQRLRPISLRGCDVGGGAVKFVELAQDGDQLRVARHALIQADWGTHYEGAIGTTQQFLATQQVGKAGVALNVAGEGLLMRSMEFAKMPERDLRLAMRWNFRKEIEGPLEQLRIQYMAMEKPGEDGRRGLFCFALQEESLERRRKLAEDLHLKLSAIEPNASAILAAFEHNVGFEVGTCCAIVDVGFMRGAFYVVTDGVLRFVRELPGLELQILRELLAGSDESIDERWEKLHSVMAHQEQFDAHDSDVMREYYSQWLVEVQRSIDTFVADHGAKRQEAISRVYLTGAGALLPTLPDIAVKNLGIPVEILNPFARIPDTTGQPIEDRLAPLYTVAVGLALPRQ